MSDPASEPTDLEEQHADAIRDQGDLVDRLEVGDVHALACLQRIALSSDSAEAA